MHAYLYMDSETNSFNIFQTAIIENLNLIQDKIANLKKQPGCYIWKDKNGIVIYVGKAIDLSSRVRSYLNPNQQDLKTSLLQKEIYDLDWIITANETDALILESTLIKKYSPRFNVRLKDDKRYPYICVSTGEAFPRVYITRNANNHAHKYFGPFADARATRHVLQLIYKIFPVRKTKLNLPLAKPVRPCLNYQMKRCLGPCQGNVPVEDYNQIIEQILRFLEGRKDNLIKEMKLKMAECSLAMEFEAAARYRDMIADIDQIRKGQTVVNQGGADEDIIAFARKGDDGQVIVMEVRDGRLEGKKSFPLKGVENASPKEILLSFLRDYYLADAIQDSSGNYNHPKMKFLPGYIILPENLQKESEPFLQYFIQNSVKNLLVPKLKFPSAGDKKSLLNIAQKNAEMALTERLLATKLKDQTAALEELKDMLKLDEIPAIIECYDISHFQGSDPVASGVMFVDGKPFKSGYRHYNMKGYTGINDPGMIHEAVSRRLQRLVNENETLPDLIVIDGGLTQLAKACEAAVAAGLPNLPIISLAKKLEEIYVPGNNTPYLFDKNSAGMRLLRNLRDEAHRFGVGHHRQRRDKSTLKSLVTEIPDIGTKRKKEILKYVQGKNLLDLTIDQITEIPGIGKNLALQIHSFLHAAENEK